MQLSQPWPEPYRINARSSWGPRKHPITGEPGRMHHGIDVACPVGTPLTAAADGEVVHKGRSASAGFNLIIRHAGNWHTVYYHIREPSHLPMGARVKTGDRVAWSGNTGASTGPHLHFELRRSRAWGDTVDPAPHIVKPHVIKPEPEPEIEPDMEVAWPPKPITVSKPKTQLAPFVPHDQELREKLGAQPHQSVINGKLVGGSGGPTEENVVRRNPLQSIQQRAQSLLRPRRKKR